MSEFNYQWENIPSEAIEHTGERIKELLAFTQLPPSFFKNKICLDAGCGNGRYTYAMQQLGANVVSIDKSIKAIEECEKINPDSFQMDIMELDPVNKYNFVLAWGVIHHMEDPLRAFKKLASQVKQGGMLHIMVYNKDHQKRYTPYRKIWKYLPIQAQLILCKILKVRYGGNVHGWFDALNPKFNWSFNEFQIRNWFISEGFFDLNMTRLYDINFQGTKK